MSIYKSYAVFGLGRYGSAVAQELVNNGAEVLAVDVSESLVNSASAFLPYCKCADVTDPEVIKQLGISSFDTVIVAMAKSVESSVMAIMLCKEAGVKNVIVKCADEMHRKIFMKVGADKVVFPETESGMRLAKNLLSSGFVDVIDLSDDVSIIELDVKAEWVGKTLIELNLRRKYGLNVVAVKTNGTTNIDIDPSEKLGSDMKLVVIMNKDKAKKLR